MPVSIEELDATVRAFYEGRGDQVPYTPIASPPAVWTNYADDRLLSNSKNLPKPS
jgi:hypothetical protein